MKTEKLIQDILAASRSVSQKGDVSQQLLEQGFFDDGTLPKGLKRDKFLSGGNPVNIMEDFERQQKIKGD